MIPHPIAAWADRLSLSRDEIYRRYLTACEQLNVRPRAERTLWNGIRGYDNLGPHAVEALALATDGAVTVQQILEYNRTKK